MRRLISLCAVLLWVSAARAEEQTQKVTSVEGVTEYRLGNRSDIERVPIENLQVVSRGSGSINFDIAKGRIANSTVRIKLEGNLTIDIGVMQSEVRLTQTETTTVKTRDENPVKR